ncbi:acyl-CoA dehydrogenase family protein [Kitasatospora cinereorecta]|uniref:Acyl-CoA dehydrogenase family protein n=1 Tax=Kitasatospora cinereorecta TaxID=285560 RepID=A0ABW0V459_9ACTN
MSARLTAPADLRELGRSGGLAAGLTAVLDGLDPAATAPAGVALLPVALLPGSRSPAAAAVPVPHPFAAFEGLALVRFPHSARGPGLTGGRAAALASVRIGLLSHLLDLAVDRLKERRFGGVPLIDHQLVSAAVADAVIEIELAVAGVSAGASAGAAAGSVADDGSAGSVRARHERLTGAGWTVTRLFGAAGYLTDHPVRALHLSALAADLWLAPAGPGPEASDPEAADPEEGVR